MTNHPHSSPVLRRAFAISETAVDAVLDQIKPGMTELQVCGIVQHAIYMNGGKKGPVPT